ncbi:MAG: molybdopterin-dependent oxidoreductase [Raoultibacter sp.]
MKNMNRKSFLALSAICAATAGVSLSGCSHALEETKSDQEVAPSPITKVTTICGNCHNNCGVIASVQDGVIIGLEGNPDHPFNKGTLCAKGQAFFNTVYAPDRLRYPMKRVGERGSGDWERIEWDEAYTTISEKLLSIKEHYGPEALLSSTGAPVQNIVRNAFGELYARYGTVNNVGAPNTCFVPRLVALKNTYGFRAEEDYNNADLIINWGGNPFASMRPGAFMCYEKEGCLSPILDAIERGAGLVVIDPVYSETAAKSTQWIAPRPATDTALALAMINVIISESLYDAEFVDTWTLGFAELTEAVASYTPEWAEKITDVPAQVIADLARLYATTPRAVIHDGNNFALHTNCVQSVRAIGILTAITGHVDAEGGNCCFPDVVGYPERMEIGSPVGIATTVTPEAPHINAKKYPMLVYGLPGALDAIETGVPYTPRAMMFYHTNVAMIQGEPKRTIELLNKLDFIVGIDLFRTQSMEALADIILPDSCYLERFDYRTYPSAQGVVIALRQPVIDPPGDVKTAYQMEYELAQKMGLGEAYPWTTQEEFIDYALKPSGLTVEKMKEKPVNIVSSFKYRKFETGELRPDGTPGFNTPSGKVELKSIAFEKMGYDPIPTFVEAYDSVVGNPEIAAKFPLVGINRRTSLFVHFKYRNNPYLRELHSEPEITLNSIDAKARKLSDGEQVSVSSPTGTLSLKLRVSERVKPGVALLDGGWGNPWDYPDSNMNQLVNGKEVDPISQSPDLNSFLIEVSKA